MKKILDFVKKHDSLIMLIVIIIITLVAGNFELSYYDDLYLFGNLYKLCNGQIIYKDVNILVTPIFYLMCKFILNMFAKNYITFKIIGIIIGISIYFTIYNIQKELKISKIYRIFNTISIIALTSHIVLYIANYNTLALLFLLIGILYTIKNYNNKPKTYNLVQSIFVALTILTDQKMGVGYIIAYILSERKIKNIIKTAIYSLIWAIIFILIELASNNLQYFWNMCVLNTGAFTDNVKSDIIGILGLIGIITIFVITILYMKKIKGEYNINYDKTKILLSFSIGSLIIIYPILNEYHVTISIIIWLILAFYELYSVFEDLINEKSIQKIISIITCCIFLFMFILNLANTIKYVKHFNKDKNSFYYGMYINDEDMKIINNITDYIVEQQKSNKNIKIVSPVAMLYTIPLNIDNWYFDLPLTGNLGKEDYQILIDELKSEPDGTLILIENDKNEKKCYQTSKQTIDYIKNNYKKIEEVEYFDVYEK